MNDFFSIFKWLFKLTNYFSDTWPFKLRGPIPSVWKIPLAILGVVILLSIWLILTHGENPIVQSFTLPHPLKVLAAYGDLISQNSLIQNTFRSIGLNMAGYVKALLYSVFIGFLIGLYPLFRGMFQSPIDAIRFVPLAAATSMFIAWFGIDIDMKINFLAFGIFIFLTPIIVQRINEVKDVFLKTVYTIGATDWQTIRHVYIPSVFSRIIDDVRVLTAISWTYITVVEATNSEEGGLGAMIYTSSRISRIDKKFAILILIIIIGIIQDRIFVRLDKELFPHKFQIKDQYAAASDKPSLLESIFDYGFSAFTWSLLGVYIVLALNEFLGFIGGIKVIDYLFGQTCWVFHLIMLTIIAYKLYKYYNKNRNKFVKTPTVANG